MWLTRSTQIVAWKANLHECNPQTNFMIIYGPYVIIYGPYKIICGPYRIIYASYMSIPMYAYIHRYIHIIIYGLYMIIYETYMLVSGTHVLVHGFYSYTSPTSLLFESLRTTAIGCRLCYTAETNERLRSAEGHLKPEWVIFRLLIFVVCQMVHSCRIRGA